mmetsp:Transcript_23604/g.62207  ORF Transcript_23604/g.62207 Transcript_23604/m.62207 type:complete len:244 (+) Transcript_23604:708-1439(+)
MYQGNLSPLAGRIPSVLQVAQTSILPTEEGGRRSKEGLGRISAGAPRSCHQAGPRRNLPVPCTCRNLRSEHPQAPRKNRRELDSQWEADLASLHTGLRHSERIPAGWLRTSRPPPVRTDLALVGRGSRKLTRRMHRQRPQIRPGRKQAFQVGSKRTPLDSTQGKGHWSAETYLLQVPTQIGVHRCLQLATTESPPNLDQPPWVVRNLLVEELRTERSQLGLPLVQRRIHRGQAPSRLQAGSLH